jgi:outer membrane protein
MIKKLSMAVLASLSLSGIAQADTIGFEVGGYQWTPDYTGTFSVDQGSQQGTELDIASDLGYTDNSNNVIWASLEHPVPLLPNFKIVSTSFDASSTSTLTRDISFGGETFSLNENVASQIDMSNTEYTFYYELLDNWINLDAGITLRQYDGVVSLKTDPAGSNISESEVLDFTIPLLYLKGRVDLPLTGFFVDGELNIISFQGNSLSDTAFSVGYESEIGLGAKAGYRTFSMVVDESDFVSDLDFSGAYLSVFFHF